MRQITHPEMSSRIALSKIYAVAAKIRDAQPKNTEQGARNETYITEAIWLARRGDTSKAFSHLALAKVPVGSVAACCSLRSAQYGCASHGYPRSI